MKSDQKNILDALGHNDIYDVYMHNGKVYFLNQWDEDGIRRLINDLIPEFDQKNIVLNDEQSVSY